jgi:hypothetical protein
MTGHENGAKGIYIPSRWAVTEYYKLQLDRGGMPRPLAFGGTDGFSTRSSTFANTSPIRKRGFPVGAPD